MYFVSPHHWTYAIPLWSNTKHMHACLPGRNPTVVTCWAADLTHSTPEARTTLIMGRYVCRCVAACTCALVLLYSKSLFLTSTVFKTSRNKSAQKATLTLSFFRNKCRTKRTSKEMCWKVYNMLRNCRRRHTSEQPLKPTETQHTLCTQQPASYWIHTLGNAFIQILVFSIDTGINRIDFIIHYVLCKLKAFLVHFLLLCCHCLHALTAQRIHIHIQ